MQKTDSQSPVTSLWEGGLNKNKTAYVVILIAFIYGIVLLPVASALLLAFLLQILPDFNFILWISMMPILYFVWLSILLFLCIIETRIIKCFYRKPHKYIIKTGSIKDALFINHLYLRMVILLSLPYINVLLAIPGIAKFVLLAYSTDAHVPKMVNMPMIYLPDPDLTFIDKEVIIGAKCKITAHSLSATADTPIYRSAPINIGPYVTIGGNSLISMGVKIESHATVELGSNVTPYTRIPAGEVWGGNPAIFLRKTDTHLNSAEKKYVETKKEEVRKPGLERLVADALHLPLENINKLNSQNCMEWDSLGKMAIAAALYDRFTIEVPEDKIFELNSFDEIHAMVSRAESDKPSHLNLPGNPELLPLYDLETVTSALISQNQKEQKKDLIALKVIVASSFVAQPLASSLMAWTPPFGFSVEVKFCDYNQILQTLLAPDSPFTENSTGLNVILVRPEDMITESGPGGKLLARQYIESIKKFCRDGKRTLIVSNLPAAVSPFFHGDKQEVEDLRSLWRKEIRKCKDVEILDFAEIIETVGKMAAYNSRLEAMARTPYSQKIYQLLGISIARLLRKTRLPSKKVIALDCDGTLWGGVLGEEKLSGIQLGQDYPGRNYRLFQQRILQFKKRGVLLVLVSKNEENDVWEAFDSHPEMILKREDITAARINWSAKSQNLRELAKELNVGLDSFVFVDDSPVERLEVESNAPEVTVLPLPEDPSYYCETLSGLWLFDTGPKTAEDSLRTQFMASEKQRKELQDKMGGLDSFLHSLNLQVTMRKAEDIDLPRVAQLTQKTNQFNLSLRRRTLQEIKQLTGDFSIWAVNVKDCFSDYGLVGVCFLQKKETKLIMDTFLLSCRALGRGVEESFLYGIFQIGRKDELSTICAPYVRGPRNRNVRKFLLDNSFVEKQKDILESEGEVLSLPDHVAWQNLGMENTLNVQNKE